MDRSRRSFLQPKTQRPPRRPPWARLPEEIFTTHCTRCAQCIQVCPTGILIRGSGGFPEATFERSGCDECGKCLEACEPGAISQSATQRAPWTSVIRIDENCLAIRQVECRICQEHCTHRAIQFKPRIGGIAQPEPNEDQCTGCGHCLPRCPTLSISLHDAKTAPLG